MHIMRRAVAAGERRHGTRHRIVLLLEEDRDVLRLNLAKRCVSSRFAFSQSPAKRSPGGRG
jgi:hypothetical protein